MRYAFAGNRNISCNLLKFIISKGYYPKALLVMDDKQSNHVKKLIELSKLSEANIFFGKSFTQEANIKILKNMQLDYIIGIHFPYIIPNKVLECPKIGFLNLHPAYLPFNKGWHTPSWAILDKTKYGATLHFMSQKLDEGDIIHQKEIQVSIEDTADTLYSKTLKLEEEVLIE